MLPSQDDQTDTRSEKRPAGAVSLQHYPWECWLLLTTSPMATLECSTWHARAAMYVCDWPINLRARAVQRRRQCIIPLSALQLGLVPRRLWWSPICMCQRIRVIGYERGAYIVNCPHCWENKYHNCKIETLSMCWLAMIM